MSAPARGLWSEADCGTDTVKAHPDPTALVKEYLTRDTTGAFTKSDAWLGTAVECPDRVPGFDSATLVDYYVVVPMRSSVDTFQFEIRYARIGFVSQDSTSPVLVRDPGGERDTVTAVRTPYGWRLGAFLHQPHVSPAAAAATLHFREPDSSTPDSDGVQAPASALLDILYTGDGALCSVSVAGDRKVCVKSDDDIDDPSWDPRGTKVVAQAGEHDGDWTLVLLDSTGKRLRQLESSSDALRPEWSPDGRYVFAIDYGIGSAVARWNADGTARARIPVTGGSNLPQQVRTGALPAYFQMLSFSPSGRRVALNTMHFREMLVATVGDTAMTVFRTAPRDFSYVSQSVWLDESHLLFVGKRAPGKGELWELNVEDGTVRKRGVEGLSLRDQIAISPDRQSVAVTAMSDSDGGWNVWAITLADGRKRQVTKGSEDIIASWR